MSGSVPVLGKRNSADSLENFAKRIEEHLRRKDGGNFAMERLICRILTGKNPAASSIMAQKWVEWRYGRNQTLKVEGKIEHEHRTIDPEKLTDEQLAEAERIIESAYAGRDSG